MRLIQAAFVLIFCSAFLIVCPAGAVASLQPLSAPQTNVSVVPPANDGGGIYDPFLGQGDLLTRAVPVCCCFVEDICLEAPPGSICHGSNSPCRCSANHACALP
jgi:hypothetical protein